MSDIKIQYYSSPFGELILGSYQEKLCLCDWRARKNRMAIDKRIKKYLKADFTEESSTVIQSSINQLNEYFKKERKDFTIPLVFCGTDFQQTVWTELLNIPYGKTASYAALSRTLKNEKGIRAISSANGANAISILIPCHRIIGSNGELVGYAGGLEVKQKLLELESLYTQTSLF